MGGRGGWVMMLCAPVCISPHLFSTPLILVLPAAPHTKPQSPNPQGGEKGGQLYSAAPLRASYGVPSAGSDQRGWPWSPSVLVWKVSTWKVLVASVSPSRARRVPPCSWLFGRHTPAGASRD